MSAVPIPILLKPARFHTLPADFSARLQGPEHRLAALKGVLGQQGVGGGDDRPYLFVDGVAVIRIRGLLYDDDLILPFYGMSGYGGLIVQIDAAVADPAVKSVLLVINSAGGVGAPRLQQLAETILAAREVKPIVAAVEHMAFSAAYWIASAAKWIVLPPLAEVGSIGVWILHMDLSEHFAQMGVKPTFVFEGDRKIDGNMFQPLSDEARAEMQAGVSHTMDAFVQAVVSGRALSESAVRGTQARDFADNAAIVEGLADEIDTPTGALGALIESAAAPAAAIASQ